MRIKAILLTVASAIFGAGFGTATAEPVSGGQASEFRLLNTSSASASDGRLLWSGAQTHDPQMCWQVFQSCQFF